VTGVFLDTSALFAAADRSSEYHESCASAYRSLLRGALPLVTSSLIVGELHALTLSRAGPERALQAVRRLTDSLRIQVEGAAAVDITAALDVLGTRPGRSYTIADAVSFEVMRRRGIERAFTLDSNFRAEGFLVVP
jgi:predicted nucleic acid-binding protein